MAGPAYVWDEWRFEPTECRLMRDGVVVQLPAKTLDLLATLLRRAPRLVTKEEILAAVWRDAAVEEGNIAFHVAALRKVLDQDDRPSAIETVRGRGYRFVPVIAIQQLPATDDIRQVIATTAAAAPPVPAASATAPSRERSYRALIVSAAIVVAAATGFAVFRAYASPPSVAVQPFTVMNPNPGQEHFPEGLGSYLTSKLALAGVPVARPEAADATLSGQLVPTQNGFRVNVQLTDTDDGERMWDWSFDVSADEERPVGGPDDERSRIQALIAVRAAEGVRNYFNLSADASGTR